MAVSKKCDRCGKHYDPYRDNGKHKIGYAVNGIAFVCMTNNDSNSGRVANGFDLCPNCLDAVVAFVMNPDESEAHDD